MRYNRILLKTSMSFAVLAYLLVSCGVDTEESSNRNQVTDIPDGLAADTDVGESEDDVGVLGLIVLNPSLLNPGFESGVTGWSGLSLSGSKAVDTSVKYSDTASARLSANSGNIVQRVKINPSTAYTLSFYVKTNSISGGSGASVTAATFNAAGSKLKAFSSGKISGTTSWIQKELKFVSPDSADSVIIRLANFGTSGTVWYDEIALPSGATTTTTTTSCGDTGVSDAPCKPANLVMKTVCSSGCNYSTIQAAVTASAPGWTIQVKNGVYGPAMIVKSGTKASPIALMAYPGHKPVIQGAGSSASKTKTANIRVNNSKWIIIDGFEIRNSAFDGLKTSDSTNLAIRNNWIHDNTQQGMFVGNNTGDNPALSSLKADILIESNVIESNGIDATECTGYENATGQISSASFYPDPGWLSTPEHCHAIYMSSCLVSSYNTVRGNTFRNHGGADLWIKEANCANNTLGPNDNLFEKNIFQNSIAGVRLRGASRNTFRYNSFTENTYPSSGKPDSFIIFVGLSNNNIFKNNSFTSTNNNIMALYFFKATSGNVFDYNQWTVATNKWVWKGTARYDFCTKFREVTGWEANGKVCGN